MAVMAISGVQQYLGLASDAKPTGAAVGSVFWEVDPLLKTLTRWTSTGTEWIRSDEPAAGTSALESMLAALLVEMGAVRSGMELLIAQAFGVHVDLKTEEIKQLQEM